MVDLLVQTTQLIYCHVTYKSFNKSFSCTFVYGFNDESQRLELWKDMGIISGTIIGAWLLNGDFNNPLNYEERIGSVIRWTDIKYFRNCIEACALMDMKSSGATFTWNNKQEGEARIY